MPRLETIVDSQLDSVTGGRGGPPPAAVCNREQFDWMVQHMVPDRGGQPGVQRHVVVNDAKLCGFPLPR